MFIGVFVLSSIMCKCQHRQLTVVSYCRVRVRVRVRVRIRVRVRVNLTLT